MPLQDAQVQLEVVLLAVEDPPEHAFRPSRDVVDRIVGDQEQVELRAHVLEDLAESDARIRVV